MKKLLLTSDGLTAPQLGRQFLKLVAKDPKEIKVLFMPTASDAKKDVSYLEKKVAYFKQCNKEFTDLGIKQENLFWLNVHNPLIAGEINSYDAMYVCGGNTFYLLEEVKRTGFDKKIIDFIHSGKVYIGESAGSIIVGPHILMAAPFDSNEINLEDTTGLKITDKIICPHYNEGKKEIVDEFEKKNNCEVVRLQDGHALEEVDNHSMII